MYRYRYRYLLYLTYPCSPRYHYLLPVSDSHVCYFTGVAVSADEESRRHLFRRTAQAQSLQNAYLLEFFMHLHAVQGCQEWL